MDDAKKKKKKKIDLLHRTWIILNHLNNESEKYFLIKMKSLTQGTNRLCFGE